MAVAATLAGARAEACRFKPRPFAEDLERASVVFTGRVVAVEPAETADKTSASSGVEATFAVERYWKGKVRKSVTVRTDGSSCGLRAAVGERWLILGSGETRIGTGLPSGNVLLELGDGRPAGNEIPEELTRRLGKGRRPK